MKQYDKALKDFDSALTLPGASVIWKGSAARNMGRIYEQQKNSAKAAEAYIMALEVSKADYAWRNESLIALSRILIRDKKAEEACKSFEPVERLSRIRGYWAVQLNTAYAEALSAAGKKTDAIKILDGILPFVSEKEKEQIKKKIDKLSEDIL